MKFSNLFTFIQTPSKTPIASSVAAGLIAAVGAATLPGFAMFGVTLGAAMLTFGVLKGRDFLYSQKSSQAWERSEAAAENAGAAAAKSYFNYGKSFLNVYAWKHPIRFGHSMRKQMKQDGAPVHAQAQQRRFEMD